jgi:hypothetical protein
MFRDQATQYCSGDSTPDNDLQINLTPLKILTPLQKLTSELGASGSRL